MTQCADLETVVTHDVNEMTETTMGLQRHSIDESVDDELPKLFLDIVKLKPGEEGSVCGGQQTRLSFSDHPTVESI